MPEINKYFSKSFIRYVTVGSTAYVLEISAIIIAQKLGASSVLAVAISFWLALLYTFLLQKFFSFGDKRTHAKVLATQIIAATLLVTFNFGFTIAITIVLKHVLPTVVIRTIAIGLTTIWNFYLYKKHIFKPGIID